jgi:drug/metabolite transporter (DMT)-like permease
VLGSRIFLPMDRFSPQQWAGLALSFAGMIVAFGAPTPAVDPRQLIGDIMLVGAAALWAATTLTIKASGLNAAPPEKVMLYQLVDSAPMLAAAAIFMGERMSEMP